MHISTGSATRSCCRCPNGVWPTSAMSFASRASFRSPSPVDLNPESSFTFSLPLIIALATLQMAMSPEEAVRAVTINAAAALNRSDRIGSLDVGKAADAVILQAHGHTTHTSLVICQTLSA